MRPSLANTLPSFVLCCAIVVVAATMMHPTFASLFAIAIIAGLVVALRWCAHMEGLASQRRDDP